MMMNSNPTVIGYSHNAQRRRPFGRLGVRAGIEPWKIWAFDQTCVILTDENQHVIDDGVLDRYATAEADFAELPLEEQANYARLRPCGQ